MDGGLFAVVTTIHPPTECARNLAGRLDTLGGRLVVVGDRKGPKSYELPSTSFLSYEDQLALPLALAALLPVDHYARKNIGYLNAISQGAAVIYETDDDTGPNDSWLLRNQLTDAVPAPARGGWLNVFRQFTSENIWPRGFPLRSIRDATTHFASAELPPAVPVSAPIQQGLIDLSPDVDSIWRLTCDREFRFDPGLSILVPSGTWCPFNSQTTWWWPAAYPLMYLPSYCSFRMTDIWRSFIAQRCLWEFGRGVVFHAPEADQFRNKHDLMRDFADEVPGYLGNERLVAVLGALNLKAGQAAVADNLISCYESLVQADFFPSKELELVAGWLKDLDGVGWKCEG